MRKHKSKRVVAPPNHAAKALSENQFRLKVIKDKRQYSRKAKHKKGQFADQQNVPFSFAVSPIRLVA